MVRPAAQSFPHRGSPASSHTRVRWQPYHATVQSIPAHSSPLAYLVTPASSTSSVSPSPCALAEPDRTHHVHHSARESRFRDFQKSKFALSLVDQAVKSLCDIWLQQDIPTVFLTSGRPTISPVSGPDPNAVLSTSRNSYLPSPISPTTQPTPVVSPVPSYSTQPTPSQPHRSGMAPIKGFVHEVIRRSRTSGTVLQAALCYLEAIRAKIPDLVQREKQKSSSSNLVVSDDDCIFRGEVSFGCDAGLQDTTYIANASPNALHATMRVNSHQTNAPLSIEEDPDVDEARIHRPKSSKAPLPPLPPLPSPLLCPRRTFLASLILASKFTQDRCYSNRAWAKLSGLPPREIGRCERALGEALEWRLWVGKLPAVQSSGRTLAKSKSEADIALSGIPPMASTSSVDVCLSSANLVSPPGMKMRRLGRSATLPAGSLYSEWPHTTGVDESSPTTYSSSPSTPGLSYSPTPTESSLGDRTVQMNPFIDVPTTPPSQFATFTGAQNDKVLAMLTVPPNGLCIYTSAQDVALPPLAQRIDPQYIVPSIVL